MACENKTSPKEEQTWGEALEEQRSRNQKVMRSREDRWPHCRLGRGRSCDAGADRRRTGRTGQSGGFRRQVSSILHVLFPLEKAREVLKDETIAVIGYGVQSIIICCLSSTE